MSSRNPAGIKNETMARRLSSALGASSKYPPGRDALVHGKRVLDRNVLEGEFTLVATGTVQYSKDTPAMRSAVPRKNHGGDMRQQLETC